MGVDGVDHLGIGEPVGEVIFPEPLATLFHVVDDVGVGVGVGVHVSYGTGSGRSVQVESVTPSGDPLPLGSKLLEGLPPSGEVAVDRVDHLVIGEVVGGVGEAVGDPPSGLFHVVGVGGGGCCHVPKVAGRRGRHKSEPSPFGVIPRAQPVDAEVPRPI